MLQHCGTQTIETKRLILRKFAYTDDTDMLKNWVADPLVQFVYSEPIYTNKEEVAMLFDKYIPCYENPDYYRWAIIAKDSNECIGQIAFFLMDSKNHFAEIEYCIGREFQKKGLATEAAQRIIQFGFQNIQLHKVQICHKENNPASARGHRQMRIPLRRNSS